MAHLVAESALSLDDIDRSLEHPPGGGDDVEIGLVGTLGVAQVGHFDQRIHVRIFDVAFWHRPPDCRVRV